MKKDRPYPPDGGLKLQLRDLKDGPSAFVVSAKHFGFKLKEKTKDKD